MAAITFGKPRLNTIQPTNNHQHGVVLEEIDGLLRLYKDGYVHRPPIIPSVSAQSDIHVTSNDVLMDKFTWARIYVPNNSHAKLPVLIYFHGGGFCVGSASWSCYNNFLTTLCSKITCIIVSVNYRKAPENRLPAAYEDGFNAVMWTKQQTLSQEQKWWTTRCNFNRLFLAGDSAGANIAYNVALRFTSFESFSGLILIQPFFGSETRTSSEKQTQQSNSALTLPASDTYWRLSLPAGANRSHPYCDPIVNGRMRDLRSVSNVLLCVSEMDVLRDRNLEVGTAMAAAGMKIETVIYKGVGHAFQVLHNSQFAHVRTQEMLTHLKAFINRN